MQTARTFNLSSITSVSNLLPKLYAQVADPGAGTTPAATDPPAATTAAAGSGAGAGASKPEDVESGDWIESSALDENQKKFLKRVITQNKNRKSELDEVKTKLTEREKKDADEQRKRDEEQGNWKKIAEETDAKLKSKDSKLMRAEVRAHAIKEGIVDPSIIDLLPLDGVSLDDNGNVQGIEKFVSKYKKEKAYLFGETKKQPEGTTTPNAAPSPNTSAVQKDALKMTAAEFAAAEKELSKPQRR